MKVKEFIALLQQKYDPDDELYFTTAALDCEFVFDKVTVEDKDDETDVFLEFDGQHRDEFLDAVFEDRAIDMRDDIMKVVDDYLPDCRVY